MTKIQKLKDAIFQLKKNKEQTIGESVRIERELPQLEKDHGELAERKRVMDNEFEILEKDVR